MYHMIIRIPSFMLKALRKCWQLGPITRHNIMNDVTKSPRHFQFKKSFDHFLWKGITKMVAPLKIMVSSEIMLIYLPLTEKKHRNEILKKLIFLLILENKDTLCSVMQTYFLWNSNYLSTIPWSFSNIFLLEAKS